MKYVRRDGILKLLLTTYLFLPCGCDFSPEEQTAPSDDVNLTSVRMPESPDRSYVGTQACVECHADYCEQFALHPMGHSAGFVQSGTVIEDYAAGEISTPYPQSYLAKRSSTGETEHQEILHDLFAASGQKSVTDDGVLYRRDEPMTYFIGSGKRGRSYLSEKDGMLFQSALGWYSTNAVWDLSPGYENVNRHFERRITDGCLSCHVGNVSLADHRQSNRFEETDSNHAIIEASIGCERCHGPGKDHVEWQQEQESARSKFKADPIIKLADLSQEASHDLCYQCHLIGVERILRYGRSEYDFRPGDRLEDIWVCYVGGSGVEGSQTNVVSHVQQMRQSKCYLGAEGELGCISCHDPHRYPEPEEKITFYRSRCMKCHEENSCQLTVEKRTTASPEDSCVECHMPRLKARDVPHTSQTDHRILRDIASVQNAPKRKEENKLSVFDNADERIPPVEKDRAKALMMAIYAESENDNFLAAVALEKLEEVSKNFSEDDHVLFFKGLMAKLSNDTGRAILYWDQLLERSPDHELTLRNRGMLAHDISDFKTALNVIDRYLKLNPWDSDLAGRRIHILGQSGNIQLAKQEALIAIERFPHSWRLHGWIAEVMESEGNTQKAELHQRIKKVLIPRGAEE